MSYHPHSHLELARSRQDDFLRDAERHRLAKDARREAPGLRERLRGFLGRRKASRREAPRLAPAPK